MARRLGVALGADGRRIVTAESCTGGLVAAACTSIEGSSDWFDGAFVTYTLDAKVRYLGVDADLLATHGAVSEPTARAMAEGALARSAADLAVAVTGIAGPGGGEPMTPVGTVWFAWSMRELEAVVTRRTAVHRLTGSRATVRTGAVQVALEGMLALVASTCAGRRR